jgi:hypothetical protein
MTSENLMKKIIWLKFAVFAFVHQRPPLQEGVFAFRNPHCTLYNTLVRLYIFLLYRLKTKPREEVMNMHLFLVLISRLQTYLIFELKILVKKCSSLLLDEICRFRRKQEVKNLVRLSVQESLQKIRQI